ncbi:MAG: glycosyltransferase [Candidatus Altiarchaeota archaeon]|nr:glycosyltransferase [Candidatus Altiarchaeota archaeon]
MISVIVPMFNEEGNVEETIGRVEKVLASLGQEFEIVVVDDGSSDATFELAERKAAGYKTVRLVRHRRNMGLGEALKTGFRESLGDVVVTIDADLSYNPDDIPRLLENLDGFDIVVGSPYMPGGRVEGIPYFRLLLSRMGNKVVAYAMSTNIHTVTSMFRAYRKAAVDSIDLDSPGPELMPEIIAKACALGFSIAEIPVVLRRRVRGKSKFRLVSGLEKHFLFSLYEKPAAAISVSGLASIAVGCLIALYLGVLYLEKSLDPNRPLMTVMPLLLMLGVQLLFFGVMADQIAQLKRELYRMRSRMRK